MSNMLNIKEVVPHAPPMILIDELVEVGLEHARCRVKIDKNCLFFDRTAGFVPSYVGIEFMAQTIAAWAGFHSRKRGEKPSIGFLLGGRRYKSEISVFEEGLELDISCERLTKNDNMAAFSCVIEHDGTVLATCDLTVYELPEKQ